MKIHPIHFDQEDDNLIKMIVNLMDSGKYVDAMNLINKRLAQNLDTATQNGAMLKAELAGLLIDIGEKGLIEKAVNDGLDIIIKNIDNFRNYLSESSLEYNFGNAKSAQFKIQRLKSGFKITTETIQLLTEAKNHYWRSYKLIPCEENGMRSKLLVNLANTLSASGRITEALSFFDTVLQQNPHYSMAQANRSEALLRLNSLSDTYSINLLQQALEGYKKATQDSKLPTKIIHSFQKKQENLKTKLEDLGYSDERTTHDIKETIVESGTHSNYRIFCIDKYLTLSEHSLYCNCLGARRDDLTIPKTTEPIGGDFIPKMELMLNRLKSEYALARLLFYQSEPKNKCTNKTFDNELAFTELNEGETISTHSEMLRVSFRLCFGVLDKIAHGICELFELSDPDEPLYFESFWKPRGKSVKQQNRWSTLSSIDNMPLLALYSQATDLNAINGEWGSFKKWRNSLEHRMFILTRDTVSPPDTFKALNGQKDIELTDYTEFENKTLHLLQLTRSAIFNFVFCVRREGLKVKRADKSTTIRFEHKQKNNTV